MIKKILVAGFFLFFICLVFYFFFHFKKVGKTQTDALKAVPSNASLIFKFNKAESLWADAKKNNEMWKELITTEFFQSLNENIGFVDSLIKANPPLRKIIKNNSLIISAHTSSENKVEFLYAANIPDEKIVAQFLSKQPGYKLLKKVNTNDIYSLHKGSGILYYSISKGIFISSKSLTLLEASLSQLNQDASLLNDASFKKVYATAGTKVEGTLFVNYNALTETLKNYLRNESKNSIQPLETFAGWSALDINLRPSSVLLTGFTEVSTDNFLSLFNNQQPQKPELIKILPSNTTGFLYYGFSDYSRFRTDYINHFSKHETISKSDSRLKYYGDSINTNLSDMLLSWVGKEAATISITNKDSLYSINIFKTTNIHKAKKSLLKLTNDLDSVTYHDVKINHLNADSTLLEAAYGSSFKDISDPFYIGLDGYIVFSESVDAIKNLIKHYNYGHTLEKNKNYKEFSETLAEESNLILYLSVNKSGELLKNHLLPEYASLLHKNQSVLTKFQSVAFQYTVSNKLFYNNIYLKYNPFEKTEILPSWVTAADTTISSKSFITINHLSGEIEILVQDAANNIYLISNSGKILWEKKLAEKIIGKVHQVDALKNKKLQFLFNTKSSIFLIDRNGNDVAGFPLQLTSNASAPLAVFDYDLNKQYRIIIPLSDKTIYNYTIKGEKVTEWTLPQTLSTVVKSVKHFSLKEKDYLVCVDINGNVYVLDRKGQTRLTLNKSFPSSQRNDFYIKKGNEISSTHLLTTDPNGKITLHYFSDSITTQKFEDLSPDHFFIPADLNNDSIDEFIISDQSFLKVYSNDTKLFFQKQFNHSLEHAPDILNLNNRTLIGQFVAEEGNYYLFDHVGNLYSGFPVPATSPFNLIRQGNRFLLTGANKSNISSYHIE